MRSILEIQDPPIDLHTMMPLETVYADDCDFFSTDKHAHEKAATKIEKKIGEWDLIVNKDKTEYTDINIAEDKNMRGLEAWRKSKCLGSMLCSIADMKNRMVLANMAYSNFKRIWIYGKQIKMPTKIKLYEAIVVPIVIYNSNSWALPRKEENKIDAWHRNHLRQILKKTYPIKLTNEELYNIAQVRPISERVKKYRWDMLGKVLRSPENSPAYCSLIYAINSTSKSTTKLKGRVGRPQTNLLDLIENDLLTKGLELLDLESIKEIARNKTVWEKL